KTNKESVRAIQKSIFTVCLDAPMPRVSDGLYSSRVAAQMLHGGGARWNSGNRWFDKTLQVRQQPDMLRSPMVPLVMPQKLRFNITPEVKRDIENAKQNMNIFTLNNKC
ncbi:hypothetical protein CRUP_024791, partial [Coryphaenoides rupestris]